MIISGWFLYLLVVLFILLFWIKVRGLTFEELLERSVHEHEYVKIIFAKHPQGGSWHEFKQWLKEQE
jgi:hypothetical protein